MAMRHPAVWLARWLLDQAAVQLAGGEVLAAERAAAPGPARPEAITAAGMADRVVATVSPSISTHGLTAPLAFIHHAEPLDLLDL